VYAQITELADDPVNIESGLVGITPKGNKLFSLWKEELLVITEPAAMLSFLDNTSTNTISNIESNEWLSIIDGKFSLKGQVLLSTAKLLMRIKASELAITYFQKTVSLGTYLPYVDMMIAQCKQELKQYDEAEFFFKKAIKANPKNPIFYSNYAKLLVLLRQSPEAKLQFELGYQKGSNLPACVVPYCMFLAEDNELTKAISIAEQLVAKKEHPALLKLLISLKMQADVKSGKDYYTELMADKLNNRDMLGWLVKSCLHIDSNIAEQDFIRRCLGHWNRLNDK